MANNGSDDRLWTLAETADYLGLTYGTVKNKVSRGEIPVVRFGRGSVRVRKSDLDAWLDSRSVAPVPAA